MQISKYCFNKKLWSVWQTIKQNEMTQNQTSTQTVLQLRHLANSLPQA